ncbi:uncharacterized protein TNCV_364831 [Trichonephila clavipes]|nr:uncharacterized protein TNCV_364831 [Trichonephila clavipes]
MVELIPTIVNKFRLRKFGITADIEKAFLQIGLQEKDRPFLRFLWWENGNKEKTKIYQHKRIVFGITSSPFLLGATLEYHLKQGSVHLQLTAQKLLESFYVDNCLTSVDNAEDIERFMLESKKVLSLAKFNLRGWVHTGVSEAEKGTLLEEEKKVPVLGLIWKPDKDTLSVNWEEISKINEIPVTKRKILSAVHRIFDPIGFTCPVTLEPKILLQECWKLGISWDTELPLSISRKFERWKEHLKCLNNLETRCISELSPNSDLSLHVFCDAKGRLRETENVPIYCWSDSVNALYWIKRKENWGTFVNNRVQEIRRLTNPEDWKHIPGILNPADLPSRGCGVVELIASLWRVLSECIICKRFTVRPLTTLSPPLPEDRVREAQIFEITGVDYVTTFSKRSDKILDCAVHLCSFSRSTYGTRYLLSTESFILALRRFISRRGRPFTIYSDNGKNLVGTSNELKNIDWKKVKDYGSLKKINWKLNPPSSPWWGVSGNGS